MPKVKLSLWERHVGRWGEGCGNTICESSRRCLARGAIPCDLLFIGEAPGESENVIGAPFVGPAGHLLDEIIANALRSSRRERLRVAFTNLVGCLPRRVDGRKAGEPDADEVLRCKGRLADLVALAAPRIVFCVGALAAKWVPAVLPGLTTPTVNITHPAAILRANVAVRDLMGNKVRVTISTAVEDLK